MNILIFCNLMVSGRLVGRCSAACRPEWAVENGSSPCCGRSGRCGQGGEEDKRTRRGEAGGTDRGDEGRQGRRARQGWQAGQAKQVRKVGRKGEADWRSGKERSASFGQNDYLSDREMKKDAVK